MLEVKNLSKKYEKFELDNVSFRLEPGYIMGFIGPNGAGKSTTIRLIMNLIKKDSGFINVFGKDHIDYEKDIKDRIGFVYEVPYFYENLTMEAMAEIIAPFYSKWDDNKFRDYGASFGLDLSQKISKLSQGTKMKFSIALALSHDADLIIMDEPTSGLDPVFRREVLDILYEIIQSDNKSIFFSTHITTDLEKIADYITFIHRGQIVFSKSIEEVYESYYLIKGGLDLVDEVKSSMIGLRKTNIGFECLVKDKDRFLASHGESLLIERPSLEDIMYFMTRRE